MYKGDDSITNVRREKAAEKVSRWMIAVVFECGGDLPPPVSGGCYRVSQPFSALFRLLQGSRPWTEVPILTSFLFEEKEEAFLLNMSNEKNIR